MTKILSPNTVVSTMIVSMGVFCLSVACAMADEDASDLSFGQLLGHHLIHETVHQLNEDQNPLTASWFLVVTDLKSGKTVEKKRLSNVWIVFGGYWTTPPAPPWCPARWRASGPNVLITGAAMAGGDMSGATYRVSVNEVLHKGEKVAETIPEVMDIVYGCIRDTCPPLTDAVMEANSHGNDYPPINYSIVPLSDQAHLLVLQNGDRISTWRYECTIPSEEEFRPKGLEKAGNWSEKLNEVPSPFTQAFHAFISKDVLFLVTNDGKVWKIPDYEQPEWSVSQLPESSSNPVRCVIAQSNGRPTYAFTSKNYFKLEEPIEVKPSAIVGEQKTDIEFLLDCARFIASCQKTQTTPADGDLP